MSELAIRASRIGKRYRLADLNRGVRFETLRDSIALLVAPWARRGSEVDARTIWALREVSFEIGVGEVVGFIGPNGAGKSTLLKILARITEPTEGEAEILGRVSSLLEIGAGFHADLTGRENVYLNGAILGMKRAEVARRFDEIVSFAGFEAFLDTPVKRYSIGMYTRLAFAIAAHLEPDTLIIDEVLSVGDAEFQARCLRKIGEVSRQGRTVLLVSHNLHAIRALCKRALVLGSGTVRFDGAVEAAIDHYLANSAVRSREQEGQISFGEGGLPFEDLRLHGLRVVDGAGSPRALFDAGEAIRVEIDYQVVTRIQGARTVLMVSTEEGELAFASTDHLARDPEQTPGRYRTSCLIPGHLLGCRKYLLGMTFEIPRRRILAPRQEYLGFRVSGGGPGPASPQPGPGVIAPALRWTTERI